MRKAIDNLNQFIEDQKQFYPSLGNSDDWDDDLWQVTDTWLPYRGKSTSLRFDQASRLIGFNSLPIEDRIYIDFMKSILVFMYRTKNASSFQKINAIHIATKRLYAALILEKGSSRTSPIYIDSTVAICVDNKLFNSGYKNIFDAMCYQSVVIRTISMLGITLTPIVYENRHKAFNVSIKRALAKKRLSQDEIDDTHREDEKIISWNALKAYAYISNNPKYIWVKLGCRILDLCIVTGMRADEILYLPLDCWRKVETYDDNTGEAIKDKNNEIIYTHGIRYDAEKGAENRIHWLSAIDVPIAKRAIDDIKKITDRYRTQAKFIKENGGQRIINWPEKNIFLHQVIDFIVSPGAVYRASSDPKGIRDHSAKWVNNIGVNKLGKKSVVNPLSGKKINDPFYRVSDFEYQLRNSLSNTDNSTLVSYMKDGRRIEIDLCDLLIVAPPSALTLKRGARVHVTPQVIPLDEFNVFIGSIPGQRSIFDEYGFTEEDGSRIKLTSHMARHSRNTFLALAGMTEHAQAIAMGRKDIRQNEAYQHLTLQESHRMNIKLLDNKSSNETNLQHSSVQKLGQKDELLKIQLDGLGRKTVQQALFAFDSSEDKKKYLADSLESKSLLGELQDTFNTIKESEGLTNARDFVKTHAQCFHVVPNGACTRDITLHGCPSFLKCIDDKGCSHLYLTGRHGEHDQIQYNYKNSLMALRKMEREHKDNSIEQEFIERQRAKVANLKTVLQCSKSNQITQPVQIFSTGKSHNITHQRQTIADLFSLASDNKKEGE